MRLRTSVKNRLLILVASQTTIAAVLVITAIHSLSNAASDYRHMYSFQVQPIVAINEAMEDTAKIKEGVTSSRLELFYDQYRRNWETAAGNTPDAIRFKKELFNAGETGLPETESRILANLGTAIRRGDNRRAREYLVALQNVNTRYADLENQYAMVRLQNARIWLFAIGILGTGLMWLLGFHVLLAVGPRIQNLVSHVGRFQESGNHQRIGDTGKDDIAVLANAIDVGFAAIASRERDREQFLAVAAHELKTPVTSIQGYASLLVKQPEAILDSSRALEIINHQAWRLGRLIEALFLAVSARSGGLHFEPRPLDMSELVRRVLREMQPFVSAHSFDCRIAVDVSILGDEALLEHALWRLFTCASALSPQNAPVLISLAKQERATLSVDIHTTGMPAPELQELFLPFRTVQYECADGLRSSIGLYLCREIVRVHNGRLSVHELSEFNPEFLMELPI